jgi:hypothetical protein
LKSLTDDDSGAVAAELIRGLFGPNSFTHFSSKKNMDILNPLCCMLDSDQITHYIEYLSEMMANPSLKEFYLHENASPDINNEFAQ